MVDLNSYGYTADLNARFQAFKQFIEIASEPARVITVDRSNLTVVTQSGKRVLRVSAHRPDFGPWPPVVGDWVGCNEENILFALPRSTYLSRPSSGYSAEEQIMAANVEVVLIVDPLSSFSTGRVERMAAIAHNAGVEGWLVGTKRDLVSADELELIGNSIARTADRVFFTSIYEPDSLDELKQCLVDTGTAAVFGRSGAGKSSLINLLTNAGLETQEVRDKDGKGRHTTTRRSLHQHEGIILIDSPGVREIPAVEDLDSIDSVFLDIIEVAQECYFSDCAHDQEPDCAVQDAIEAGELSADRLSRYRRMQYEALRNDPAHRREQRRNERQSSKNATRGKRFAMMQKNRQN